MGTPGAAFSARGEHEGLASFLSGPLPGIRNLMRGRLLVALRSANTEAMMTMFEFTLVLESKLSLSSSVEDSLFEAGLDDALVGSRDDVVFVDFEREGASFLEAVLVAIHQVESALPGALVRRVEPDEFVTAADIASRIGRTRESIRLLVAGKRGPGGFPAPVRGIASKQRLWMWSEVAGWLSAHVPGVISDLQVETAESISTLNSALHLRLHPDSAARSLLVRLAG